MDRVQAAPVPADKVWEVFGPYILALLLVNLVGQICSKLQDYAVYKLQINGNYHLARLCFDTLSNQSMTFHTSRFGGALVSQTSKFMSGYTQMVDVVVYSLIPTIASTARTSRRSFSTKRTSPPCGRRAAPCAPPCSAASPRAASSP